MVKGGGAALTREKIVAAQSRRFVCIADESKLVERWAPFRCRWRSFPWPPRACAPVCRAGRPGPSSAERRLPLVTDNGQHILDVTGLQITDPLGFESDGQPVARRGHGGRVCPPEGPGLPAGHPQRGANPDLLRPGSEPDASGRCHRRVKRSARARGSGRLSRRALLWRSGGRLRLGFGNGHQRRGRRPAVVGGSADCLPGSPPRPGTASIRLCEPSHLLVSHGEQGQRGLAAEPLQGLDVGPALHRFFGEGNAAAFQVRARCCRGCSRRWCTA
jgi:hypothetical protein